MATLALLHRTRKIKSIIVGTAAICLLGWAATRSDEVVSRVNSPIFRENASLDEMHGSSLILYNHAHIAWENVSSHPMFGTGLGSHPIATERFSILRGGKLDPISLKNAKDASSMLLRILSEFGFCGLVALSTFIWACRPSTRANHVRDIAVCCLIAIALQLFRQGNFVLHGFPFFVLTLALLPRLSPKNVQE